MKIIRSNVKWWVGKIVTCAQCDCVFQLEDGDCFAASDFIKHCGAVFCPGCRCVVQVLKGHSLASIPEGEHYDPGVEKGLIERHKDIGKP